MFFDYDAHATAADDQKIDELLSFFDDETEDGLLFISYPMVEAIRHFRDTKSFKSLTVKCKRSNCPHLSDCPDKEACLKEPTYKQYVATDSRKQLSNMNAYTKPVWQELINAHLCKANYLVKDQFTLPKQLISQKEIFLKQLEKHIHGSCPEVAVLSAFPLYVLNYFGCERIIEKLHG